MRTLFIDCGHSAKFPGAIGFRKEHEFVRSIKDKLIPMFNKNWQPIIVPTEFKTDIIPNSNLNLTQRISWINKNCKDGDWLISIHANAASNHIIRGVTTIFMSGSSHMLGWATVMSRMVSFSAGSHPFGGGFMPDTASRFGRLGMVRDTRPTALLIECGFVTNKNDMDILPEKYAKGIANFFNSMSY